MLSDPGSGADIASFELKFTVITDQAYCDAPAATWTKAKVITEVLDEFQKIVLEIVTKIVIPLLPIFIGFTFCCLSYEGTITKQLPVFILVVVIVMIGHYIWLALLYGIAGIYAGKNPLNVIRNYGSAYLTAVGTMSSAATLAVALSFVRPQAQRADAPFRRGQAQTHAASAGTRALRPAIALLL